MRESPPHNPISNDYMQLPPMWGQGEARDGYSRYRRSASSESIWVSCHSSSASSRGPQTPNEGQGMERDGCSCYYQSLSNRTLYEHGHSSPDDDNGTLDAKRQFSKGLPSPVTVHNTHDTSLPIHNVYSTSPTPSCDLYQYPGALHSHLPPPFPPKRRCSSLSPPFRQREKLCGRQLSRSQPGTPMFGEGSCSSLSMHGLVPSFSTDFSNIACQQQCDTQYQHLRISSSQTIPMAEGKDCTALLMPNTHTSSPPSKTHQPSLNMQDEEVQTNVSPFPDVPTVEDEGCPSSTMCNSDLTPFPTTPTSSSLILLGPDSAEASAASPASRNQATSTKLDMLLLDSGGATIKSPMDQLIQEYSSAVIDSHLDSTERSIMLVLSLEELTLDHIVDRGEVRARNLPRYHLVTAVMNNLAAVVTAQQIFLQQAAALIVDRKSYFIVDPGNTLIPILQGTSSLPQLYTVWRALITRVKLGVKAWEKYIAEYQLQVGSAALSSLSTSRC